MNYVTKLCIKSKKNDYFLFLRFLEYLKELRLSGLTETFKTERSIIHLTGYMHLKTIAEKM